MEYPPSFGISGTISQGPRNDVWAGDPDKDAQRLAQGLAEIDDRLTIKKGHVITMGFSQGGQVGLRPSFPPFASRNKAWPCCRASCAANGRCKGIYNAYSVFAMTLWGLSWPFPSPALRADENTASRINCWVRR